MSSRVQGKKTLPAWLLGLANLPAGLTGGLALLTMPQWLAARHVPEPVIAEMTTLCLVPTFLIFVLGPLFDIWFSRRTYAIVSTLVAAGSASAPFLPDRTLSSSPLQWSARVLVHSPIAWQSVAGSER
jgi:hypothetical protein